MQRKPNQKFQYRGKPQNEHRLNNEITATEVRLIGEGIEPAVYSLQQALAFAQEMGVDLVEVSPNAVPPVCRVIEYKKFLYEKKKKDKEQKAKSKQSEVKEIRFTPNTDEHDFNFKLKHAVNFLKEGAKVKAYVHFVGRTIVFKERGEMLLLNFAKGLEEVGKPDDMPKLEGKRMSIIFTPKAQKK